MKKEDVEKCSEVEKRTVKYDSQVTELTSESRKYNLVYLCNYASALKYIITSDGEDTIDGVILVVSAKEGIMPQTREIVKSLESTIVPKVAVYIVNDADTTKVESDIKELLKNSHYDVDNTPIVKGSATDEASLKDLMKRIDSWINRVTEYNGPSVVQSYQEMKLYTYFKTKEEGGIEDSITKANGNNFRYEILDEKISGTLEFEEGTENLMPGDTATITVKLSKKTPLETGVRIPIYNGDKLIGIGVVSEMK